MSVESQNLKTALSAAPIVPVLTVERVEDAAPIAAALAGGGIRVAEVTLRTPAALPALAAMRREVPDLVLGAGTITQVDHISAAIESGAQFLVSPGTPPTLTDALLGCGVPALPGVATAGEAMTLVDAGFEILKLFPAVPVGGVGLLKSLNSPLPDILFMPTGGVNAKNAQEFLALPNVIAVGGSWMVRGDDVAAGNWAAIEDAARAAVNLGLSE
ncbi:MAG: bifunctional 4-hydroxy-2-oxoglutarate aldolase/2-dehydro-3-deoxy-phosphogluconate aldolase [Pseudomonadota bacterium]